MYDVEIMSPGERNTGQLESWYSNDPRLRAKRDCYRDWEPLGGMVHYVPLDETLARPLNRVVGDGSKFGRHYCGVKFGL